MATLERLPTPEENAKAILARRSEALVLLEEARATGNRKEIRSLESVLRKWDKLISEYGLERYA